MKQKITTEAQSNINFEKFASSGTMADLKQHFKICFCLKRTFRLKILEPPPDIKHLFDQYAQNGTMAIDDLQSFLLDVQGEDDPRKAKEDAHAIFNSLKHLKIFERRELRLDDFFKYLLGDLNTPLLHRVHHDMTAPLAHYFLFTGHNSYLTGNQLSSKSSVDPIKKALLQGVRVIELDLWPNDRKNNVEVRHGGTLTDPVDLIKCLRTIKENAFVASEYPVVITFEDHLTPDLQAKVATMVTTTFGDMLFYPESDQHDNFLSPESLKNRVLISTKPPKEYLESESGKGKDISRSSSSSKNKTIDEEISYKSEEEPSEDENVEEEHLEEEDEDKTVPEYRKLIAIHAGKPKGDKKNLFKVDPHKVRRLSLSEQELENAARTHSADIIRFTQRNLLRVYPKGMRFDSSNYNPFTGWMHGAQMVAFNMQGRGKHLWVMQGMFKANGGCGYVKKPNFLLQNDSNNAVFNPYVEQNIKKFLKVKVFMGHGWDLDFRRTDFDLYSPPDFFVKVAVAGVPFDKHKHKTKEIEDNWLPQWNEEFEFPLTVPELAVLRIEVWDHDTSGSHDFGGQTCLPISELRTGIRAVPLHDRKGDPYKHTRLLMQFEFH